jgi:hypothetical protein
MNWCPAAKRFVGGGSRVHALADYLLSTASVGREMVKPLSDILLEPDHYSLSQTCVRGMNGKQNEIIGCPFLVEGYFRVDLTGLKVSTAKHSSNMSSPGRGK